MFVHNDHFQVSPQKARSLFARSVHRIEIEVSAYCNRVCSYCPNSFIDRRTVKNTISDALFSSIMSQLSEINWNGVLTFHRYNEPLSDRDYILSRIREARKAIPRAKLTIFTNGDYLTEDYLKDIYDAGVRFICATVHVEPDEYTDEHALELLNKRLRGFSQRSEVGVTKKGVNAVVHYADDMLFNYQVIDWGREVDGDPVQKDRGQALGVNSEVVRTAPCAIPFTEMQIELDGTLVPCCHVRSDVPAHAGYRIGKLTPETDIFEAWTSNHYVEWRKSLSTVGPKAAPCATCTHGIYDADELSAVSALGLVRKSPLQVISKVRDYVRVHGVKGLVERAVNELR